MNLSYLINNALSCDMAIDPGTETTLIYIRGEGIVLREHSYVAYDKKTRKVLAFGEEAYDMVGKTPQTLTVAQPIMGGVIVDYELAFSMFMHFIKKVCKRKLLKPRMVVCVPQCTTEVEKRAFSELFKDCGAREVYLLEDTLSASLGAGCDISIARGMLTCVIGSGRCDVASISCGRAVCQNSMKIAGDDFTYEIIDYIKNKYDLIIGYQTAENIKTELGCAYSLESETFEVMGMSQKMGLPDKAVVSSGELKEIFYPILMKIAEIIKKTIEETPMELQTDILTDGILLCGGASKLSGLDKWLKMQLGVKVFLAERPIECCVLGVSSQLLELDLPQNSPKKYYFSING